MKEVIGVSACLLGLNVRWDGKNNKNNKIIDYLKDKTVILICPEVFGGLSIPRFPSEIKDNAVVNSNNKDVSKEFNDGAEKTLELLKKYNCTKVILKDGSPSCGVTYSYDGTFTHTKVDRMGITAKLLKDNNIEVISLE